MNNQTNSTNLVQKYTQTEYCFEIDRIPISKITSNNLKPKGINCIYLRLFIFLKALY